MRPGFRRLVIWSEIFEFLVTVTVAALVWKFVAHLVGFQSKPAEPDDSMYVIARLRPRPKAGAGAVALAEPEYDDEESQ